MAHNLLKSQIKNKESGMNSHKHTYIVVRIRGVGCSNPSRVMRVQIVMLVGHRFDRYLASSNMFDLLKNDNFES